MWNRRTPGRVTRAASMGLDLLRGWRAAVRALPEAEVPMAGSMSERLNAAADALDRAAADADRAAGRFAEARLESTPWGISAPAREIAARWEAALAARDVDARILGDATSDLAGQLRMAARGHHHRPTIATALLS
ncbi:hypothetical protein SSMG_07353 [Streptomyces sp. AA4]|nr:hypothetical protein SSMG_07353 [Streptomyces sp. AA4]